ncbi:MAG TPA: sigma-70 family RNA polymerase sigma factor [Gemmataceae bacterium]|nr:sigma-70 family RNA polymerase sigma factor [Gemmataceae bacterium]
MMLLDYWSNCVDHSEAAAWTAEEASLPTTAEEIFYAYAPRVYNLARRMLDNDADAEDVTQEVLLQVIRKLDTFRGEAALTTWLNRVTVNAALLHRRKQSRRRERQVNTRLDVLPEHERACAAVSPRNAPEKQVMDRETQELIENAIARLPNIYRDVYVLADVEDMPNAAIGELLSLEVPAVKSRLHRARLMMREVLTPHF